MDRVVDTVSAALERNGQTSKAVSRWFAEMPREEEMLPKDKYTLFDKKEKSYRKSIHSMFLSHLYFQCSHQLAFYCWIGSANHFLCLQSCPSGLVSANVSTLPVSKRIFLPRTCTIHPNSTLAGKLSERKITYGQPEFWLFGICSAATLQRMVAYNVP